MPLNRLIVSDWSSPFWASAMFEVASNAAAISNARNFMSVLPGCRAAMLTVDVATSMGLSARRRIRSVLVCLPNVQSFGGLMRVHFLRFAIVLIGLLCGPALADVVVMQN